VLKVLLLQGPVGPFFKRLQAQLIAQGHQVWRVAFHAGDRIYSDAHNRIHFEGNLVDWQNWLSAFLDAHHPDSVVLFGCERPAHRIARELADAKGLRVLSLEEGYLRTGFVTAEEGGNNARSPIAEQLPPDDFKPAVQRPVHNYHAFRHMAWHAFVYYSVRAVMGIRRSHRALYHLQFQPLVEAVNWVSNFSRFLRHRRGDQKIIRQLSERAAGRYFLVPLQVATDANQRFSSLGWDNLRLAVSVLKSFTESAPEDVQLVFKVHPMERGHSSDRSWIRSTATALGLGNRVHVIDTGSLGELARHAAGMITINSTSGLTAIFHGIPLLAVGESLYAHPALATCAHGDPDFDAFWHSSHVADAETRRRYLAWLRESALVPGDFYNCKGIGLAVSGVIHKITQSSVNSTSSSVTRPSAKQKVVSIFKAPTSLAAAARNLASGASNSKANT